MSSPPDFTPPLSPQGPVHRPPWLTPAQLVRHRRLRNLLGLKYLLLLFFLMILGFGLPAFGGICIALGWGFLATPLLLGSLAFWWASEEGDVSRWGAVAGRSILLLLYGLEAAGVAKIAGDAWGNGNVVYGWLLWSFLLLVFFPTEVVFVCQLWACVSLPARSFQEWRMLGQPQVDLRATGLPDDGNLSGSWDEAKPGR